MLMQKNHCSHAQKRPKNARRNARATLEKRTIGIGQRSISLHSTNNDGGVANTQRVGEGG
jgi:hypothetical protein